MGDGGLENVAMNWQQLPVAPVLNKRKGDRFKYLSEYCQPHFR